MQKAVQHGTHIPDLTLAIATPDYTGSVAWLYGFDAVIPAQARVLELGCGEGEWLAAQAARWSDATWTGIELLSENKQEGQERCMATGLENLAVCSTSLEQLLSVDIGQYDYIIVHNTFSLLSNHKIECVLQYCGEHLSAQGLIAFAWACNPGAKNREVLRDAVQMHAAMAESLDQQIDCVRGMLSWFSLTSEGDATTPLATTALDESDNLSDELLVERYLRGQNEGQYLLEFNGRLNQLGLGYVGDLKPWTESPDHYNERIGQMLSAICPEPNKILSQQYLDFATNRSVRFSLLCHQEHTDNLSVFPDKNKLSDMLWAGSFRRIMEDMNACNAVRIHDGTPITITDDNTLSVMDVLGDAWPFSLSFDKILTLTLIPDLPEDDPGIMDDVHLRRSLQALFDKGVPGVHFRREGFLPPVYREDDRILPVSGWQRDIPTNIWNEPVQLTDEERAFLEQGDYTVSESNVSLHDNLSFKGLMQSAPFAWQRYLQSQLFVADEVTKVRLISPLIIFSASDDIGGFQDKEQQRLAKIHPRRIEPDMKPIAEGIQKKARDLYVAGEFAKAESLYQSQVEQYPNKIHARYLLANFYVRTCNREPGLAAMYNTIVWQPQSWNIYYELATLYYLRQYFWLCGRVSRSVLRFDPNNAFAWDLLARLHTLASQTKRAEYCYIKACDLDKNSEMILSNRASLLSDNLRSEEALVLLRQALKINKFSFNIWSSMLFDLTHNMSITPEALFAEHLNYAKCVYEWIRKQHYKTYTHHNHSKHARLRIGFVSGDLCHHPVSNFLLPVWEGLDRRRFDIYGYSTSGKNDKVTERFRKTAQGFREVIQKSAIELAEMIKHDEIDILIDLSGHTAHNRLLTFALHPAPVQMAWIGYPGTTGLSEIDYRIMSPGIAPKGMMEPQFAEKLLYVSLPRQFTPEQDCPDVTPLPALGNGHFTFASFNRPMKISQAVVAQWARVLHAVPTAKMLVGFMANRDMVEAFTQRFADEGIGAERLIFRETQPLKDFLVMHKEVDLLLDAFPYTGGTTTNHAAWMGVPTITLAGKTMASRQGVDIMNGYGLSDFVADSLDDYVARAIDWASRTEELNAIRQGLREKVLADLQQQHDTAEVFARMLTKVWQIWSDGEPVRSFTLDE